MSRSSSCFFLAAVSLAAQPNPIVTSWVVNPAAQTAAPALKAVLPNVQSVRTDQTHVCVESAGLSLQSLGALEAGEREIPLGPRRFAWCFPLTPMRAEVPAKTPLGVVGAFRNGVPIYNPTSPVSWRDQNFWHLDAVAESRKLGRQLPNLSGLIGFAFDGYPVYAGASLRSGYQFRKITRRTSLPDGTELTPSQEGPPVSAEYPLGSFVEDFEYSPGAGDLDEHNGREVNGSYAYFLTTTYPYILGSSYYGKVDFGKAGLPVLQTENTITYAIHDAKGRNTRFLETVHEKPIHLIIVSSDLADFAHVHPELQSDDTYRVDYHFPHGGAWSLYADHTPPGSAQMILRSSREVPGPSRPPQILVPDPPSALTKTQSGVTVKLTLPATLTAGQDLTFRFDLSVTDLEPYLGAWAHIVIISEDREEFIHAHPLEDAASQPGAASQLEDAASPYRHSHAAPGPSPATVSTVTGFRKPGLYRLWLQFQRQGNVITVPYTLRVLPGEATPVRQSALPAGVIPVHVSASGFSPARIQLPAGKAAVLAFERPDATSCANTVVFPELNIRKPLPPGQTVLVDIPASAARELHFACGMNMYRGSLIIR